MAPTVLIVDDEPHIRLLIEQTLEDLEDEGVTLLTAQNGEQALAVIRSARPALIFLDVMMPRLDGFEVCQLVKRDPTLNNAYIVMLTAKGQELDRQRGDAVGADAYITKPFDPDQLLHTTRFVLGLS